MKSFDIDFFAFLPLSARDYRAIFDVRCCFVIIWFSKMILRPTWQIAQIKSEEEFTFMIFIVEAKKCNKHLWLQRFCNENHYLHLNRRQRNNQNKNGSNGFEFSER